MEQRFCAPTINQGCGEESLARSGHRHKKTWTEVQVKPHRFYDVFFFLMRHGVFLMLAENSDLSIAFCCLAALVLVLGARVTGRSGSFLSTENFVTVRFSKTP